MSPLAALTAIVFGSACAITFGLVATLVVFIFLKSEHSELAAELPTLLRSCLIFIALIGVSGGALYGEFKKRPWRHGAQAVLWLAVAAIGWVYWPRS